MRGLEARLRRLETGRDMCPLCEAARAAFLESLAADKPGTVPRHCAGCGRDIRPTVFDIDKLLELEGEGGGHR